ncbi:hypothetical protein P7D22_21785 [Lichenihabitans sp. Uapishka_5]|uniref:hypothetical protein n=1 Tax=Lichenihabitans sp. Uapishka_5 TaxID=3037302 RepID=UPI0029E80B11|nr:hypothetical protein [Lichenihabitans sp. Uapishka_5]MDX7953799.1 hypothetical protein [Lichenihabitans sp. Uapishka_5]
MFDDFAPLQAALESVGCVGFWEADYSVGRLRTTGQLTTLYGLTAAQGEQGASWSDIDHAFHPDDINAVRRLRRCPTATISGSHVIRFRMIDADGQTRQMEAHGNILVDRAGMLTRTKGLVFEVTEGGVATASLPAPASLAGLDRLSANVLQSYREAKALGLTDVETELKATLFKVANLLGKRFRIASSH